MIGYAIALALASAVFFGLALVLAQLGFRQVPPVAGAAIAIPSGTVVFVCAAPFMLQGGASSWGAVLIFAIVGLFFPATVTLLTYEANRLLGPVVTGTLGNLAPVFAIALAFVLLGEPVRVAQLAGLVAIVCGVAILGLTRSVDAGRWSSWFLLLPLAAAALRGLTQPAIKLGLDLWPSPFAAAVVGYVVSSIVVIAAAKLRTGTFLARPLTTGHAWFVGVGLCNALAVLLMYAALANGPVVLVSPLVATYPLATLVASTLILGKSDSGARLAFGAALAVAGVALLIVG